MGAASSLKERIYEGWLQTATSVKYYAILSSIKLDIFASDVSPINEKAIKSIDLRKYDRIKPISFNKTQFKYGFRLKDKTKNRIMYGCKSQNERNCWLTHIHYIITHKISLFPLKQSINKQTKNEIKHVFDILLQDNDVRTQKCTKKLFINANYKQKHVTHSIADCKALSKLLFVDKLYRKWCDVYDMIRPYSINNVITNMLHYDMSSLLDDFVHCTSNHKYIDIYDYLQSTEYLCVDDQCPFLLRNHRDRDTMRINELSNRISLYLCFSDSFNISTMQLLDKIHCYLLHSFIDNKNNKKASFKQLNASKIMNTAHIRFDEINVEYELNPTEIARRQQIWKYLDQKDNKFVVNCDKIEYDKSDSKTEALLPMSYYYKAQTDTDMDEKFYVDGSPLFKSPFSMSISTKRKSRANTAYSTGSIFSDNGSTDSDMDESANGICIKPKYKTFHNEITKNKIYSLSNLQFDDTYINAMYWIKTERIQNIVAKNVGVLNIKSGIIPGTIIGINHIMSLLFYCNYKGFQNAFRKLSNMEHLKYIAHCSRYIYEAVHIFGEVYNGDKCLYVSLNKEMLFDQWNIHFIAPVSTTDNVYIVSKYVYKNGVILKLTDKEAARYFDMSIFTDFCYEEEKLFMNAKFSIQNIILSDMKSLLYGMYSMELFKRIMRGQVFSCFAKDLMSLKSQSILLHLMQNYVNKAVNKYKYTASNKCAFQYLCNLFNYIIDKQFKHNSQYIACLNVDEIKRLNTNLSLFFYSAGKIGPLIRQILHNKRIIYAVKYEFILFEDKWNEFFELKCNEKLKCGGFIYEMDKNEKYIFGVEVGVDKKKENCMVYVKLTCAPITVDIAYIVNDIVLKETRSEIKYQKAYKSGDSFPIKMCKINQCQMIKTQTLSFVMSISIISTIYK